MGFLGSMRDVQEGAAEFEAKKEWEERKDQDVLRARKEGRLEGMEVGLSTLVKLKIKIVCNHCKKPLEQKNWNIDGKTKNVAIFINPCVCINNYD